MAQLQSTLPPLPDLGIEGMEFVYRRNFEGRGETFNDPGNRYFNAKIPNDEMARRLEADGWNIKWTKPGQNHPDPESHVPEPYLEVAVGFTFRPPQIMLIKRKSNGEETPTVISENTASLLDSIEFTNVDVVIRARAYRMPSGTEGYKAYLKEFYGTTQLSDIGSKYAHLLASPAAVDEVQES